MAERARVGSVIGKSGAQCTDIIHNPVQDVEKPYLTGVKGPERRGQRGSAGWSGNRMRSHGFGPSKPQIDESVPKLTKAQKTVLKVIDAGDALETKHNKALESLELGKKGSLDLVVLSRDGYRLTAEGRRVVDLI